MFLVKTGFREVARAKGRMALVAVILALQATTLGGGLTGVASIFHTRDHYYAKLHFADLQVTFTAAADTEMPSMDELRRIPGVAAVTRRFLTTGYIEPATATGAPYPVLVQYVEPGRHPEVDDVDVLSGHYLAKGKNGDALIDRTFAAASGLKLGDEIVVNPYSFPSRFKVSGVGLSPEFLIPTANQDVLVPSRGSLGIVYANHEATNELFVEKLFNDLVFSYQPGADRDATQKRILAALAGLDIERVTPRAANFAHRYIEEVIGGTRIFLPITALILALMAAIVSFITVSRIIAQRRREIGALMAIGYPPRQFLYGFLPLGLVPGVAGAILGVFGSIGYGRVLAGMDARVAGFPPVLMTYSKPILLMAAGTSVVVGLLAALIPMMSVLRLRPNDALRGGVEIRMTRTPRPIEWLLRTCTSTVRYAIRNLFRRTRLTFATVALIGLAVAMPAAFLSGLASWTHWATAKAQRLPWDAAMTFKVPLEPKVVDAILKDVDGLKGVEGYIQGYANLTLPGRDPVSMRLRGVPVPSSLQALEIDSGRSFSSDDADEVILNKGFSRSAPPPPLGTMVTVESNGRTRQLKVVGLISDVTLLTMYTPLGTAHRIVGKDGKSSGAYLALADRDSIGAASGMAQVAGHLAADAKPDEGDQPVATSTVRGQLLAHELVSSVQSRAETTDAMLQFLASARTIIAPFVGMGVVLAFLFLLCVLGFVMLERESEYATLRSMGFGGADISKNVFTEVAILAAGGLLVSVPMWIGLTYLQVKLMAISWAYVPMFLRWQDLAYVAAPTVLFLVAAALPAIRMLCRLDLSSVLRARAMG